MVAWLHCLACGEEVYHERTWCKEWLSGRLPPIGLTSECFYHLPIAPQVGD
jgi:hypothetical protein